MTIHMRMTLSLTIVAVFVSVAVRAQAPAPPVKNGQPGAAAPVATPDSKLPAPPPNYEYHPEGRRDPFVSLVNRGNEGKADPNAVNAKRVDGVPGLITSELTVRGILLTRGAYVAMVSGPDNKVYTVRAGARLADGIVRSINANSVVILQEVNDPLSLEKQREVRKLLRGGEEVK
jgi:Tfp pilus assembly protein PilP